MDRVEFIRQIEESNITHADILSKFFDQYMILYDLIEKIDQIIFINSDNNSVTVQLFCSDEDIIRTTVERIKYSTTVIIYEKCFNISYSNITKNTVDITISLM